ncbi:MAG: hypothetical protein EOO06_18045 [Chitinophagaceae bacterium]|nr:MAG: hypothetical protein EOO06_18045 [Chitinophagaceae bacterium]
MNNTQNTRLDTLETTLDTVNTNAENIQLQIDDIVTVNDQQTSDILELRNDHDTHVDNAVLLTGNQTIGGGQTFTSNIILNGISNTSGLAKFGSDSTIIHTTKPLKVNTNSTSRGLTNVLCATFVVPANTYRTITWNIPSSVYRLQSYGGTVTYTDTLNSIPIYSITDELSSTVSSDSVEFNTSVPKTHVYANTPNVISPVIVHNHTSCICMGTATINFTPSYSTINKTYTLQMSFDAAYSSTNNAFNMETSCEVNTTIFPQPVNSSVGNGEYYQGVILTIPSNITIFLAGSVRNEEM